MRKLFTLLLAAVMLLSVAPVSAWAAASDADSWLNKDNLGRGVIGVHYKADSGKNLKLQITKDGLSYTYDLAKDGTEEFFPLQSGNGSYKIAVMENTGGNKYKNVYSSAFNMELKDGSAVYLNSIQNINWSQAGKTVQKAKQLTAGLVNNTAKVQAIYDYITASIVYDDELAASVKPGYIPELDDVLRVKKGICYDYASLFAAMARSAGIPAKLLMGASDYVDTYHAWNQVYLNGEWVTVDTTVDAVKGNGVFAKDASKYRAAKVY